MRPSTPAPEPLDARSHKPTDAKDPSIWLRALRGLVRARILRRGYFRVLKAAPVSIWGGAAIRVSTDFGPMVVSVEEPSCTPLLFWGNHPEERPFQAVVEALMPSCSVVMDIGAHYGTYSRLMASSAPHAKVHSFEPDPDTFRFLAVNTSCYSNVKCNATGVREEPGDATFWKASSSNLSSISRQVGRPTKIRTVSVDSYCIDEDLSNVDFIKCDVEGAEYSVVEGAANLMKSDRPPIWMLEIIEQTMLEAGATFASLLSRLQLECPGHVFTLNEQGLPVESKDITHRTGNNFFFVPAARLQQFTEAIGVTCA